jgi:rod shape-determining protein MreC
VHEKQVRRRRAVLALLVAVSLVLLTAYFGESPSSPLHSIQRGIVEVFSPIQEGASKALKPFSNVGHFFSDTFKAKSQVNGLRNEVYKLNQELAQAKTAEFENNQLRQLVGLNTTLGIQSSEYVTADVITRDPTLWYAQIEVDKGSADGVALDDPVIGDDSLVGKVTTVGPTFSEVTLITDHSMSVTAQVIDQTHDTGELVPDVGDPNHLLLQDLPQYNPSQQPPGVGDQVVTAGFKSGPLESLYPAGIPIGTVSNASQSNLVNNNEVQVAPLADLRQLAFVEILTKPQSTTLRASLP